MSHANNGKQLPTTTTTTSPPWCVPPSVPDADRCKKCGHSLCRGLEWEVLTVTPPRSLAGDEQNMLSDGICWTFNTTTVLPTPSVGSRYCGHAASRAGIEGGAVGEVCPFRLYDFTGTMKRVK